MSPSSPALRFLSSRCSWIALRRARPSSAASTSSGTGPGHARLASDSSRVCWRVARSCSHDPAASGAVRVCVWTAMPAPDRPSRTRSAAFGCGAVCRRAAALVLEAARTQARASRRRRRGRERAAKRVDRGPQSATPSACAHDPVLLALVRGRVALARARLPRPADVRDAARPCSRGRPPRAGGGSTATAPMFCGSSCAQTTSLSRGYARERGLERVDGERVQLLDPRDRHARGADSRGSWPTMS